MSTFPDRVKGLVNIYNTIRPILPGNVSIYGLDDMYFGDEPHEEIFVLDIRDSGGMEEVSIFYENGMYVINFWTCKPSIPSYNVWIAKYVACVSMLIDGNPAIQELDVQVLLDDGQTESAICLKAGLFNLIQILKESLDLPR